MLICTDQEFDDFIKRSDIFYTDQVLNIELVENFKLVLTNSVKIVTFIGAPTVELELVNINNHSREYRMYMSGSIQFSTPRDISDVYQLLEKPGFMMLYQIKTYDLNIAIRSYMFLQNEEKIPAVFYNYLLSKDRKRKIGNILDDLN